MKIVLGPTWPESLMSIVREAIPECSISGGAYHDDAMARDADVLVPIGMKVTRELMQGSRLRLIQQFGVGLDMIDLEAASELGIPVTNAPSGATLSSATVAEGALLHVLSVARLESDRNWKIREGYCGWVAPLNLSLAGRRAGLIGLGSIGKAIGRRLAAFEMELVAVSRSGRDEHGYSWVGTIARLDELLESSDFVILSLPLTPETANLIDRDRIARMKRGACIVNVGRGGILDEGALLEALNDGRLHGAGLDTIAQEPIAPDSRLLGHPRVMLTPHDAGVSDYAFAGVLGILAENVRRLSRGDTLLHRR